MKKLYLFFLLFMVGNIIAQNREIKIPYSEIQKSKFAVIESPPLREKALSAVLKPAQADMRFIPSLKHPKSKNKSEKDAELQLLKSSKDHLKQFPFNSQRINHGESTVQTAEILIGESFYGDIDGSCPNDNTLAISKGGRIISMMNELVGIYNEDGDKINVYTLNDFFNGFLDETLCDPKVEYDYEYDRFFMFIQGCNSDPQNIAFGFSETNNPNGNWHIYLFNSDALNDNSWSDYPKVAITKDEIFVSINLFGRGSNGKYKQSIMYQLDKTDGYASRTMNYKIWKGFQTGTILPLRSGAFGEYGPGVYAVQASAGGADYINFYDITGNLTDPDSKLMYRKLSTAPYEPASNAYQKGTNVRLDVGDCRLQDGYYQDGMIHFVFATDDMGYSGIRYHRLDVTNLDANVFEIFSSSELKDYCYPSISPFSNHVKDRTSIIHFASSGEDYYPDIRAKLFYNDFTSDGSITVKGGPGPNEECYSSSDNYARWGDYTGIARKYNESTPTVWIAGSVGSISSGKWWTFISELYSSPAVATKDIAQKEFKVYPNPATNRLSVEVEATDFTKVHFNLKDSNQKHISKMYQGVLLTGINTFSFETGNLNPGIYYLSIETDKHEILKTEKIIIHP